jgi:hypothetical protein
VLFVPGMRLEQLACGPEKIELKCHQTLICGLFLYLYGFIKRFSVAILMQTLRFWPEYL